MESPFIQAEEDTSQQCSKQWPRESPKRQSNRRVRLIMVQHAMIGFIWIFFCSYPRMALIEQPIARISAWPRSDWPVFMITAEITDRWLDWLWLFSLQTWPRSRFAIQRIPWANSKATHRRVTVWTNWVHITFASNRSPKRPRVKIGLWTNPWTAEWVPSVVKQDLSLIFRSKWALVTKIASQPVGKFQVPRNLKKKARNSIFRGRFHFPYVYILFEGLRFVFIRVSRGL